MRLCDDIPAVTVVDSHGARVHHATASAQTRALRSPSQNRVMADSLPLSSLFLQSLVIGLSIAAPVGPIGLLTIQRTLQSGSAAGMATGLGAAALGAYGVSAMINALSAARLPLVVGGGVFLLWMAWSIWRAPVAERAAQASGGSDLMRCFAGTFVLTLSNPATILSFIAVFGVMAGGAPVASPAVMVAGVLIGSALWWLLLSTVVGRLRERFDAHWRRRVNAMSALVLAGFALWQFAALARA
jgi:threonine/homoserine/homoserine lactone efflux protein